MRGSSDRSVWAQWVCLNMVCFGFGGTAVGVLASPSLLWLLLLAITVPHWLVLRPTFRNTDDFFGLNALLAGWVIGAILLFGIVPAIEPQRRSDWLTLFVVMLIVAGIFGLLLYWQLLRKSYERIQRWTYSAAISVVLSGIITLFFMHALQSLSLIPILATFLSATWFGLTYGLMSGVFLTWVRCGKDGVTTLRTPTFSSGLIGGVIVYPPPSTLLSEFVTIHGEVAVWNSNLAIWKRTIQLVEVWIDGIKRGEALLHPLSLPFGSVTNAHCAFAWEWQTSDVLDGEHLIVIQAISNQNSRAQASVQVRTRNHRDV
jgi:hypothetical protein